MATRPLLLATCLILTLGAGCATPQSADVLGALDDKAGKDGASWATPIADPWPAVKAKMADVPCEGDATLPASENLQQLSSLSLPSENDGIHAELDIRNGLGVHARYSASGFELYDLRDPLNPVHLGNWTAEEERGALDVKFAPDNVTVLMGDDNGISIVDVRDPLRPVQTGYWSHAEAAPSSSPAGIGYNTHMLASRHINGADWVFVAPNANTGIWILKLEGLPDAPKLTYVSQTMPVEGGPLGPHDMYVQQDGIDGHWYLYSADGFHGWMAFNIDDPANPMPAGGFVNPAEAAYTHSVQAVALNGKRIVVTSAEIGANLVRVYDATVMAAPILLGVWQATAEDAGSPQHNMNVAAGNLYVSYYGHGLYVFDLAAFTTGPSIPLAGVVTLQPSAHWAVEGEGGGAGPLSFNGFWDTVVQSGVVYVSHIEGGLVVLGYGCNEPGNVLQSSDG